jgi:putative ABC transport system permease protein
MDLGHLRGNLRYALQMFFKNPGFTLAVVAALALGIGANTAVFTVVNTVLLKPLTYPDADRMVEFFHTSANGSGMLASNLASIPAFRVYRNQTSAFQEVAAYDFNSPGFNLTGAPNSCRASTSLKATSASSALSRF